MSALRLLRRSDLSDLEGLRRVGTDGFPWFLREIGHRMVMDGISSNKMGSRYRDGLNQQSEANQA